RFHRIAPAPSPIAGVASATRRGHTAAKEWGDAVVSLQQFDFKRAFASGLPAPSAKFTGLAKFNFTGGNNDTEQIPLDELVASANAVLQREGRNLSTYNLGTGPQGYIPLRDFIAGKLKRDAGIVCDRDNILVVSGSLQALDLVNALLLN